MGSDKHLKLRATPDSGLGRVITYLQQDPSNQQELASATLLSRFLPFVIDRDQAEFREIAIRCANECEALARTIREYAELGIYPSTTGVVMAQSNSLDTDSIASVDDEENEGDDEVEVEDDDEMGF